MDQITLSNFRCFGEEQTARLAPLTLLVGENSTGKTSFMALIRALWGIAYRQRTPDFKEDPYDLGSFDEIAHHRGGRGGRADTFEARFCVRVRQGKNNKAEGTYLFIAAFSQCRTGTNLKIRIECERMWVELGLSSKGTMQVHVGTPEGRWQQPVSENFANFMEGNRDQFWVLSILLVLFRIEEAEANWISLEGPESPSEEDLQVILTLLGFIRDNIYRPHQILPYASAPVRSKPRRTYDPTDRERNAEGEHIPSYFARISIGSKEEWTGLQRALETFGKEAGLFDQISVKPLGKKEIEPFQVQIRKFGNKSKGPPRNLLDVGYGISQVLPVITELLRKDRAPLLLLQQPEVHLHPSAQAALGTLFCMVAGPNCQLIVETHSDHLLDRVRMDVRDRTTKLKPEDVSILYFEREDLDVHIHSLRLDKEGNVLDAPPGYRRFFMEETNRSIGI